VAAVRRYRDEIGHLDWAAPQDWMCEPFIVAKTGLSMREHLRRTVASYLRLTELAPDLPFIPVLQGWELADYLECAAMYEEAGVDLAAAPLVGVGSVCRRQATKDIGIIMQTLAGMGLKLHGFGVKTEGLHRYGQYLASADSMAWSLRGRHIRGCRHRRRGQPAPGSESNCLAFARAWRAGVLRPSRRS